MGYDWTRRGTIPLREGVTIEDVVNAFYDEWDADWRFDQTATIPGFPGVYSLCDDASVTLEGGLLDYTADSNSGHLDDAFGAWLGEVAERFAAGGWADYYGDAEPDFMGPTPAAVRLAKLEHYSGVIAHAQAAIAATLKEAASDLAAQLADTPPAEA